MALREEFEKIGNWLFRWRSYLPLLLSALFLVGLRPTSGPSEGAIAFKEFLCLSISFIGLGIRVFAVGSAPKGTSGRNVKEQRADALNKTGLYSLVRHPLYLGNFFLWFGASLLVGSFWVPIITALIFWLYYEKIMFAEEEFLRREYGDEYVNWSNQTRAFWPLELKNWKQPALPFQWRNAIRREYSGFFGIMSVFSLMKLIKDSMAEGRISVDGTWLILFLISLGIYLAVMTIKKKTNLLNVEGM